MRRGRAGTPRQQREGGQEEHLRDAGPGRVRECPTSVAIAAPSPNTGSRRPPGPDSPPASVGPGARRPRRSPRAPPASARSRSPRRGRSLPRDPEQVARARRCRCSCSRAPAAAGQLEQRRHDVARGDHDPIGQALEVPHGKAEQEVDEHREHQRVGQHAHEPGQRGVGGARARRSASSGRPRSSARRCGDRAAAASRRSRGDNTQASATPR